MAGGWAAIAEALKKQNAEEQKSKGTSKTSSAKDGEDDDEIAVAKPKSSKSMRTIRSISPEKKTRTQKSEYNFTAKKGLNSNAIFNPASYNYKPVFNTIYNFDPVRDQPLLMLRAMTQNKLEQPYGASTYNPSIIFATPPNYMNRRFY